jgi:hypothetical protein
VTDLYAGLLVEIVADQMRLSQRKGDPGAAAAFARALLPLAARTHADGHLGPAMSVLGAAGTQA